MTNQLRRLLILCLSSALLEVSAVTRFVDVNCPTPAPPYMAWGTAATRIQDAVDIADAGDEIVVTNGTYRLGGRVVLGSLTNRVAVTKPLVLRSANGPALTRIEGYEHPSTTNGNSSVRCVYLTNGASLFGFTITNGTTRGSGDLTNEQSGAGIWCASSSVIISNCFIIRNTARNYGGGVWAGTLFDCTVTNNLAITNGGGAAAAALTNCLIVRNFAKQYGGGVSISTLDNCTVRSNTASGAGGGTHESNVSNCSILGNQGSGAYYGFIFNSVIASNGGGGALQAVLVNCSISNNTARTGGGVYLCTLTNCLVQANAATGTSGLGGGAYGGIIYNSTISSNRAYSGGGVNGGWLFGCMLVGNYATNFGGGAQYGNFTNCVFEANRAGLNGGGADSPDYVYRCAFTNNSAIAGGGILGSYTTFVIESSFYGNSATSGGGASGGVWLISSEFINNRANDGGGSQSCRLTNCLFFGNFATNLGGGVYAGDSYTDFKNCIIVSNTAARGGGVCNELGGRPFNLLIYGNQASIQGGGAYAGTLYNSTLVFNSAASSGGGSYRTQLRNCINYYNSAPTEPNFSQGGYGPTPPLNFVEFSCTIPQPAGCPTVFTNAPAFIDGADKNFRLQANSPCINSGYFNNFADGNWWVNGPDLDGNNRVAGGTVDVGAYEFQTPTSLLSYAYLQQYALPTDGTTDLVDSDGDGINNYNEWISGTNPTNVTSVLRVLGATNGTYGINVWWEGAPTRYYYLERATNLAGGGVFQIVGAPSLGTAATDETVDRLGPYYYRVGVQHHIGTQYP